MLDLAGKLLVRLILRHLSAFVAETDGLASKQFGFRRGMGTSDAIRTVTAVADFAASGKVQDRDLCALVSLDVRNSFGSAPWWHIDTALGRKEVPVYIRSFLSRKWLEFESVGVQHRLPMTCGVP